jgi:hypothetical protein
MPPRPVTGIALHLLCRPHKTLSKWHYSEKNNVRFFLSYYMLFQWTKIDGTSNCIRRHVRLHGCTFSDGFPTTNATKQFNSSRDMWWKKVFRVGSVPTIKGKVASQDLPQQCSCTVAKYNAYKAWRRDCLLKKTISWVTTVMENTRPLCNISLLTVCTV